MSVRAKMASSGWRQRGVKGAATAFNAVYESNPELQKITENAIFGDATPNGYLDIVGEFNVEKVMELAPINDEWYIDLVERLSDHKELDSKMILVTPLRLAFQGQPQQGSGLTDFRWVGAGEVSVRLSMSIANPAACGWISEHHQVFMILRHCDGRRPQAEIAVLEKVLVQTEKQAEDHVKRYPGKDVEDSKRQYTFWIRKKIALAKGEAWTETYMKV